VPQSVSSLALWPLSFVSPWQGDFDDPFVAMAAMLDGTDRSSGVSLSLSLSLSLARSRSLSVSLSASLSASVCLGLRLVHLCLCVSLCLIGHPQRRAGRPPRRAPPQSGPRS
jgi:hypothetical protein